MTLAKSWSRLSARSVLQNTCGLLRSPLATRTSALLHRASWRSKICESLPTARPAFSVGHFDQLMLGAPFSLHGFPAPFRRRFPDRSCEVIAGYPMQTVMRFSRYGAGFGNKKSPHNNLNLTIPSGMALVRVCYVAIRKSKTCSGSFGSRAGTLSKYVILNC